MFGADCMISSAAGGVPLLMVRHPAGRRGFLPSGGGCLFSDHAFVVRQVFPFSFCVGESVAFGLDGLGHPPPRRGELLDNVPGSWDGRHRFLLSGGGLKSDHCFLGVFIFPPHEKCLSV